jgi:hypothetical protein
VLVTVVLGLVAGGIAGVLFVTAQLTANPDLITGSALDKIVSYAQRSIPFAVGIGFVAGLTSDVVFGAAVEPGKHTLGRDWHRSVRLRLSPIAALRARILNNLAALYRETRQLKRPNPCFERAYTIWERHRVRRSPALIQHGEPLPSPNPLRQQGNLYGDVADDSQFSRSARAIWLEIKSDKVEEISPIC